MSKRNHLQFPHRISVPIVRGLGLALSLCLLMNGFLTAFSADSNTLIGDVSMTVNADNIKASLPIPGGQKKVTMSFHGMAIQDALRALGKKGGFNVLIDESVVGEISLSLNNVTIQEALESVKTYGNLAYSLQGSNLIVTESTSAKAQSFQKSNTRIFHLKNVNATVVAQILNNTLFAEQQMASAASGAGGAAAGLMNLPVTADFHTNNLIVVGQPHEIEAVAKQLKILDTPRQSKTWRLSHANALDVATFLAASIFNEGIPTLDAGAGAGGGGAVGGGAAAGAGGGGMAMGMMPSQIRVVADNVQDSKGATQASQSGGGGQRSSLGNSITLRSRIKSAQMVSLSSTGPIILPDTRLNTLTLMGTVDQIAMAEAMIPTLDRKVPQVVLETSLVEISETGQKELGFEFGYNNGGFKLGSNNDSNVGIATSATTPMENLLQWTTSPISRNQNFYYRLNNLIGQNKAKLLANPTVITSSDNEAVVSIVDEIVRSVTLTQSALTAPTATINIGEAGIILNLLPKIGANRTISLRVRPIISTILETKTGLGGVITLLSKREVLSQNVQLQDGETFVLGGLIQNTNKSAVFENPALARLPIVGALARNSTLNKKRTELVMLITPHIVKEDGEMVSSMPVNKGSGMMSANFFQNNSDRPILPVSFNDDNQSNALPAMQKPHELSGATHGVDPLEGKSMAKMAPKPSGTLLPNELSQAPTTAKSDNIFPVNYRPAPTQSNQDDQPLPARYSNRLTVQAPARPDTSDAAIQAIIEKFK